ncbi:MAG: histidine phosphatase family protein [Pseudomonadota bacterium]
MPRLYLMRHADAGSAPDGGQDSDRRLTAAGREAAGRMGAWLAERLSAEGCRLDQLVFSGVARTAETLEVLSAALGPLPSPRADGRIYDATTRGLADIVRALPEECETGLLIGHNPALEGLLAALTDTPLRPFPTGGIADLEIEGAWAALTQGSARLLGFASPHQLG